MDAYQSDNEDIVIVDTKDYAQVVFDDVKECYVEKSPVECLFSLNSLLKASTADSIGIFQVGFNGHKDYKCIMPVNTDLIDSNKGKLIFEGDAVPRDDGEFYQFVYVSQSAQIRGASIPFQFRRAHISDFIEVEVEESVLIKSRESAIQDTMNEIKARCANLSTDNTSYETLVKQNEDLIKTLKDEIITVKVRCIRLTMENEKLCGQIKVKDQQATKLNESSAQINIDNAQLQKQLDDLLEENNKLMESLEQKVEIVAQLKSDLDKVKTCHGKMELVFTMKSKDVSSQTNGGEAEMKENLEDLKQINDQVQILESQVKARMNELSEVQAELRKNEEIVKRQTDTIQRILNERESLKNQILKVSKEKFKINSQVETASEELNSSKDKLAAAEQCKEMLHAQLKSVIIDLNEANAKIDSFLANGTKTAIKEAALVAEGLELKDEMKQLKINYEAKLEEMNGSYFALRTAHNHLEARFKANAEQKKDSSALHKQQLEAERLRRENEELRDRLKCGAREYARLVEKFRNVARAAQHPHGQVSSEPSIPLDYHKGNSMYDYVNKQYQQVLYKSDADQMDRNLNEDKLSRSASNLYSVVSEYYNESAPRVVLDKVYPMHNKATVTLPTTTQPKLSSTVNYASDNQLVHIVNDAEEPSTSNQQIIRRNSMDIMEVNKNNQLVAAFQSNPQITLDDVLRFSMNKQRITSAANKETDSFFDQFKLTKDTKPALNVSSSARDCNICNYIFPADSAHNDIEEHYKSHQGPSCPICFLVFRKDCLQNDYEMHVNNHFSN